MLDYSDIEKAPIVQERIIYRNIEGQIAQERIIHRSPDQTYEDIIIFDTFDGDCDDFLDRENDARDLIRQASAAEERGDDPAEWQNLYKDAADILLELAEKEPDILYDRDAFVTDRTVAAMCLEKIPIYRKKAEGLYRQELSNWFSMFDAHISEYEDQDGIGRFLEGLMDLITTKGGKFLSIKANDHESYLKISLKEIAFLEANMYNPGLQGPFSIFPLYLTTLAYESFIRSLDGKDPIKKQQIEEKLAALEMVLPPKGSLEWQEFKREMERIIQDPFLIFDKLLLNPPLSVKATIGLLSEEGVHL